MMPVFMKSAISDSYLNAFESLSLNVFVENTEKTKSDNYMHHCQISLLCAKTFCSASIHPYCCFYVFKSSLSITLF